MGFREAKLQTLTPREESPKAEEEWLELVDSNPGLSWRVESFNLT
jgi:hypothetical protein